MAIDVVTVHSEFKVLPLLKIRNFFYQFESLKRILHFVARNPVESLEIN